MSLYPEHPEHFPKPEEIRLHLFRSLRIPGLVNELHELGITHTVEAFLDADLPRDFVFSYDEKREERVGYLISQQIELLAQARLNPGLFDAYRDYMRDAELCGDNFDAIIAQNTTTEIPNQSFITYYEGRPIGQLQMPFEMVQDPDHPTIETLLSTHASDFIYTEYGLIEIRVSFDGISEYFYPGMFEPVLDPKERQKWPTVASHVDRMEQIVPGAFARKTVILDQQECITVLDPLLLTTRQQILLSPSPSEPKDVISIQHKRNQSRITRITSGYYHGHMTYKETRARTIPYTLSAEKIYEALQDESSCYYTLSTTQGNGSGCVMRFQDHDHRYVYEATEEAGLFFSIDDHPQQIDDFWGKKDVMHVRVGDTIYTVLFEGEFIVAVETRGVEK